MGALIVHTGHGTRAKFGRIGRRIRIQSDPIRSSVEKLTASSPPFWKVLMEIQRYDLGKAVGLDGVSCCVRVRRSMGSVGRNVGRGLAVGTVHISSSRVCMGRRNPQWQFVAAYGAQACRDGGWIGDGSRISNQRGFFSSHSSSFCFSSS